MLGSQIVRVPTLVAVVGLLLAAPPQAQAPLATLVSPNPDSGFGNEVASIGDVNTDGTPDVLVGAAGEDVGGLGSAGRAYVFSGATNTVLRTLVSPNPVSIGFFGGRIAALGDINGDSVPDILIGAQGETVSGLAGAGRAYVFSGATGALLRTFTSPNPASSGGFGTQVSAPGDLDGDGTDDIVVGAPRESTGLSFEGGRVHVFSGATGTLIRTLISPTEEMLGVFGRTIAHARDLNGDGTADLLIGSEETVSGLARAGRVHGFSGATGQALFQLISPAPELIGTFGSSLATVSDLTANGVEEILVGSGEGPQSSGRAYVFTGQGQSLLFTLNSPTPTLFGAFGIGLVDIGDYDGDSFTDIAVGAGQEQVGALASAGQVHVYSGFDGSLLGTFASPAPESGGRFGIALSTLPDRNGDGVDDILVGADGETVPPATRAGRAYALSGLPPTRSALTLAGAEGWRTLGLSGTAQTPSRALAPLWTQGIPGADVSQGDPTVFAYDESFQTFFPLIDLRSPAVVGQGLAVYVFEDDDLLQAGTQGSFPKTLPQVGFELPAARFDFNISSTVTGQPSLDGWNLLANPFDAAMDWDASGWTKFDVDNVIYVYDSATGSYRTWNGTTGALGDGLIAPYQGFWVKAFGFTSLLVAPPGARDATATPPFYGLTAGDSHPAGTSKAEGDAVLRLVATAQLGDTPREASAFLQLSDHASRGHDPLDAYALPSLDANAISLALRDGDLLHAIDARPSTTGSAEIPVDLSVTVASPSEAVPVTLSWPDLSTLPEAWSVTLRDTQTGQTVDLRQVSFLTVDVMPAQGREALAPTPPRPVQAASLGAPSRFVLVLEGVTVSTETAPAATAVSVSAAPNPSLGRTTVAWETADARNVRVSVHDALGREVALLAEGTSAAGRQEAAWDTRGMAPGVYVVRVTTPAATVTHPITVLR